MIASATARGSTTYVPSSSAFSSAGSTPSIVANNLITAADAARGALASILNLLRARRLLTPDAPSIGVRDRGGEEMSRGLERASKGACAGARAAAALPSRLTHYTREARHGLADEGARHR